MKNFWKKLLEKKINELLIVGAILIAVAPVLIYFFTKSLTLFIILFIVDWLFVNMIKILYEKDTPIFIELMSIMFYVLNGMIMLFVIVGKFI
jgi:hypothetical protein